MIKPEIRKISWDIEWVVLLANSEPIFVIHAQMFIDIKISDFIHHSSFPKHGHLGDEVL